jgi:hypothetical protein
MRTALEGQAGDAVKAKAIASAPQEQLWKYRLAPESKARYSELMAGGKTAEARRLANSSMLTGQELGNNVTVTHLKQFAPIHLAGRAYRALYLKHMNPDEVEAIVKLGPGKLSDIMEGYSQQYVDTALGERAAADDGTQVAKNGVGPARLKLAMHEGTTKAAARNGKPTVEWTQQKVDTTEGLDRYENALAMRVNARPEVTRAILDHIEAGEKAEPQDIQKVIKALDNGRNRTAYGSVYWEDPQASGPALHALTPSQVATGKEQWARKMVGDLDYLLRGQNGRYQQKLADQIRTTGYAPEAGWIGKYVKGHDLPNSVLYPKVIAMPNGGLKGLTDAILDTTGAGYKFLVERPLRRTTTSPVFLANYAKARVGLNDSVERMVAGGMLRETAESAAEEIAMRNALVKTEQLVDDPGQKSQLDIVGRNFFGFSRAVQAMWRRWGTGLWQDPTRARKMMLAFEGAQQSGLIYKDQYGQWTFVYPGSDVTKWVMQSLSHVPGFENIAKFPVSASMTGGVMLAVPGANDPFRMGMSPMTAVPMRTVFSLFPHHREMFDEIDKALNGSVSQSQGIGGELEPAAFKKFFTAMNTNERNSALASATVGAIQNLAASGRLPKDGAAPAERAEFIRNLQAQVRSQLYIRAVLGLIAPAQPSAPQEFTPETAESDFAFQEQGVHGMKAEYLSILNGVKGDTARANAIWNAMHPNMLAYEIPMSKATSAGVYLPSTQESLNWMENNLGFIKKYGSVAAYFLPVGQGNQQFNDAAYRTQMELGLREKKTPGEFLNDFYIRNAEASYYPEKSVWDARIAEARLNGDDQNLADLTRQKSDWETNFKALNPTFGQKLDSYPDARATAAKALQDLRDAVASNAIPDGYGEDVGNLIQAYDGYEQFISTHKGRSADTAAQHRAALDIFNNWIGQAVANDPQLLDLYQGVFRVLNTNFVNLQKQAGS